MSSSDMGYRVRQHLQSAGIHNGKACHSFWRDALQQTQSEGVGEATLLALGQVQTEGTLKLYQVRIRHEESEGPTHRRAGLA